MDPIQDILKRCADSSDAALFCRLESQTAGEREHLVETLAIIGELHERNAALPRGYSSLFVYCTRRLGYCERTAYRRISAAKTGRRFPLVLERLRSGRVHLSAIVLLRGMFTPENHESLLARVENATMEQLKRLAASLSPTPVYPIERSRVIAVVDPGKLVSTQAPPALAPVEQGELPPSSSPNLTFRTEHQFTFSDAAEAKLVRARALLAHKFPFGELESIFEAALDCLLDEVDPARRSPRPAAAPRAYADQTRRIPEWVKRKVRERDEDRCAYRSAGGVRCGERRFLQYDHIVPWSLGGKSDDPSNIRQLCGAHNRWAWRHAFVTRS